MFVVIFYHQNFKRQGLYVWFRKMMRSWVTLSNRDVLPFSFQLRLGKNAGDVRNNPNRYDCLLSTSGGSTSYCIFCWYHWLWRISNNLWIEHVSGNFSCFFFLINSIFFFWNSSKTRFRKEDLLVLLEVSQIPQKITTCQGIACSGMKALCILLKRLSFPWRFFDMVWVFGRSVPELCLTLNHMTDFIHDLHGWWLQGFNQNHLTTDMLRLYANIIHDRGSPLDNRFGLVDGTRGATPNPMRNQGIMYNWHKRIYAVNLKVRCWNAASIGSFSNTPTLSMVKWIFSLHLWRSGLPREFVFT